jgi:ABC-2 type transport system permease protein
VQTLAFPLSLPILFGYITALTVAGSGHPGLLFRVLAYRPPTAPFALPVLVGLGKVTWWQFLISVALTVAGTVLVARFAAGVYRRAILRTGRRVRLRELLYGN